MTNTLVNHIYYGRIDPITGTFKKNAANKYILYRSPDNWDLSIVPVNPMAQGFTVVYRSTLPEGDCGLIVTPPNQDAPLWRENITTKPFVAKAGYRWDVSLTDLATARSGSTLTGLRKVSGPAYINVFSETSSLGKNWYIGDVNKIPAGVSEITLTLAMDASNGTSSNHTLTLRPRSTEDATIYGVVFRYSEASGAIVVLYLGPSSPDNSPAYATTRGPSSFTNTGRLLMPSISFGPLQNDKYANFQLNLGNIAAGNYVTKFEHLGQTLYASYTVTNAPGLQDLTFTTSNPGDGVNPTLDPPTWAAIPVQYVKRGQTSLLSVPTNYTTGDKLRYKNLFVVGAITNNFSLSEITPGVYQAKFVAKNDAAPESFSVKLRLVQNDDQYIENIITYIIEGEAMYTYIDKFYDGKTFIFSSPKVQGGYTFKLEKPDGTYVLINGSADQTFEEWGATLPPGSGDAYQYRNTLNNVNSMSGLWIVEQKRTDGTGPTLYASFNAPIALGFRLEWLSAKPIRGGVADVTTYLIDPQLTNINQGDNAYAKLYKHIAGTPSASDTVVSGTTWTWDPTYGALPSWVTIVAATGQIIVGLNPDVSGVGAAFKLVATNSTGERFAERVITLNPRGIVSTADESDETIVGIYTSSTKTAYYVFLSYLETLDESTTGQRYCELWYTDGTKETFPDLSNCEVWVRGESSAFQLVGATPVVIDGVRITATGFMDASLNNSLGARIIYMKIKVSGVEETRKTIIRNTL